MTDGGLWKEQRRFTIRHLKDMGFGKSSVEIFMVDEIHDLIQDINVSNTKTRLKMKTPCTLIVYSSLDRCGFI